MSEAREFPTLNVPQRRHFEVVLASLEEAMVRIEQLSGAHDAEARLLTKEAHDVPVDFLERVAPLIASIRGRLEALARSLDLQPRRPSTHRMIRALLTAQIVHLQDSDARRLRAYGEVDPRVSSVLDPELRALERELHGILDALRNS